MNLGSISVVGCHPIVSKRRSLYLGRHGIQLTGLEVYSAECLAAFFGRCVGTAAIRSRCGGRHGYEGEAESSTCKPGTGLAGSGLDEIGHGRNVLAKCRFGLIHQDDVDHVRHNGVAVSIRLIRILNRVSR